jgi:hypothetical protein
VTADNTSARSSPRRDYPPGSLFLTGPGSVVRRVARRVFARRRLAVMELRNKLLLGHTALALKRIEDAEVKRLASALGPLPYAKVATIITTYRRPDQLLDAVRSALEQTVLDQIVFVVDDGGGLPQLPEDPRLYACSLSANVAVVGIVYNIGMRLTRSEYLASLGDDNTWEPNHLEVALAEFESSGKRLDLVYTAMFRELPDGSLMDVLSNPFDRRQLARESYIDGNSLVTRRVPGVYCSRIRRRRGLRPREDWEFIYRFTRGRNALHVPVPTVHYQVNPDSYWSDWTDEVSPGLSTEPIRSDGA